MDFFACLDKVVAEYKPRIHKIHHHKTPFKKSMEAFLSHPYKDRSWPEIFNGRMLAFKDVLTVDKVQDYIKILTTYMDLFDDPKKLKKKEVNSHTTAKDLLQFLQKHKMDPDNSLLGLTPSDSIVIKHCNRLERAYKKIPKGTKPITGRDLKAESLILRIMQWSELEQSEKIADEVRMFAFQIVTNIRVKVGDVVMCRMPNKRRSSSAAILTSSSSSSSTATLSDDSSDDDIVGGDDQRSQSNTQQKAQHDVWQYCRVYRVLDNCVIVHNSAIEAKTFSVSNDNVIPFDAEMRSKLGYVKSMARLVQDPVDILYDRVQKRVKKLLGKFLSDAGVDYFLLKKTFANKCTIYEQKQLESVLQLLQDLMKKESKDFYSKIEAQTVPEIQQFISALDPMTLFTPTREQSLSQLRNPPTTAFAKNRLNYLILTSQTNLDVLNLERRDLLNGKTKTTLTEWYLNHIEDTVDKWLGEKGYDFDAVPLDYIEDPPRGGHLNFVRDNLQLIEKCMASEDELGVRSFMNGLKDEVYERIDKYVSDMMIVLSDALDAIVIPESFDEIFKKYQAGEYEKYLTTDQFRKWIDDAFKDLEYILEMKTLEEVTTDKKTIALSKVVPITGLIFSRYHRLQNELTTVLELWAHLDRKDEKSSQSEFHGSHSLLLSNSRRISAKFKKEEIDEAKAVSFDGNDNKDDDSQSSSSTTSSSTTSSSTSSTSTSSTSSSSTSGSIGLVKSKSSESVSAAHSDPIISPKKNSNNTNNSNNNKGEKKINDAIAQWCGDDDKPSIGEKPTHSKSLRITSKFAKRRLSKMVRPSSMGSKMDKVKKRPTRSETITGAQTAQFKQAIKPASPRRVSSRDSDNRNGSAPPLPKKAPPLPKKAPPLPKKAPPLPKKAPPLPKGAPPLTRKLPSVSTPPGIITKTTHTISINSPEKLNKQETNSDNNTTKKKLRIKKKTTRVPQGRPPAKPNRQGTKSHNFTATIQK